MSCDSDDRPGADRIPLCVPDVSGNEWRYVRECLDSAWLADGAFLGRFESMVAQRAGTECAVAVVNGTAALHLALLVAGVRPGDEVVVPTLTFIAPVNAVRYAQGWPVLIDAEPRFWQMDVTRVEEFLRDRCVRRIDGLVNRESGRRVRAIVPVHLLGHPVDMDPLLALARELGLVVVEDASESLGAHYRGRPVGSLGDVSCFSFNANKIITTGGGGLVATSRREWASKVRYLAAQAKDDPAEYVHGEIGFNYRLSNLQAAVGCAQIEHLDRLITRKRAIARRYTRALDGMRGIRVMQQADWADSTFWLFTILIDAREFGCDSRSLRRQLGEASIDARTLWQPMHLSPAHRSASARSDSQSAFPIATRLYADALSLPCSPRISDSEIDRVCAIIAAAARTPAPGPSIQTARRMAGTTVQQRGQDG
jgi:perosamine synthetase